MNEHFGSAALLMCENFGRFHARVGRKALIFGIKHQWSVLSAFAGIERSYRMETIRELELLNVITYHFCAIVFW